MLKDKLSKFLKEKDKKSDPLKLNIMDGFVNIKGYKVNDDGTKKLIYHDCGDNVVTDWMRHTIMLLLTGSSFTKNGQDVYKETSDLVNKEDQITAIATENHSVSNNNDGYVLNNKQYFWDWSKEYPKKYSESTMSLNKYALFPTKILFGTGKEYSDWDSLKSENEVANASWYENTLKLFSKSTENASEEKARENFDGNISKNCNKFSGTIAKNIYAGDGYIHPTRTVNGPESVYDSIVTTSSMNKNYGVVGAIKTPYYDLVKDEGKLEKNVTESGRLLLPEWSGIGRPCFIYFNVPQDEKFNINEGWSDPTSDVYVSKDESSRYLNKITFKVVMPSQSASNNSIGKYYPYNGYKLKQMGLYNDSKMINSVDNSNDNDDEKLQYNMPCGTLLAIKNIAPIDKTADIELVMTWTLTI